LIHVKGVFQGGGLMSLLQPQSCDTPGNAAPAGQTKGDSMYKNILVPTDGSNLSAGAVREAVAVAKSMGARITGFYAAPNYSVQVYGDFVPADFITPQEFAQQTKRTAEKYLGVIQKAASAAGVRCRTAHALSDTPWKAIIKAARDNKCDLIFMASHGRRGLAALLLGSETSKVLTHSKIPVLVHR